MLSQEYHRTQWFTKEYGRCLRSLGIINSWGERKLGYVCIPSYLQLRKWRTNCYPWEESAQDHSVQRNSICWGLFRSVDPTMEGWRILYNSGDTLTQAIIPRLSCLWQGGCRSSLHALHTNKQFFSSQAGKKSLHTLPVSSREAKIILPKAPGSDRKGSAYYSPGLPVWCCLVLSGTGDMEITETSQVGGGYLPGKTHVCSGSTLSYQSRKWLITGSGLLVQNCPSATAH